MLKSRQLSGTVAHRPNANSAPLLPFRARINLRWLAFIGVFAAICGIYWVLAQPTELTGFSTDSIHYLFMADWFSPFATHLDAYQSALGDRVVHASVFPPLYPLFLGFLDAGTMHIARAHAATLLLLLAVFIAVFLWIKLETGNSSAAFTFTLAFSLLPGTLLRSQPILSENLYLLLSLSALLAATAAAARPRYWWTAALFIGLATVTRTVGITLISAFACYLFLYRIRKRWTLIGISLAPLAAWSLYKVTTGPQQDYVHQFIGYLHHAPLSDIVRVTLLQTSVFFSEWVKIFDPYVSPHSIQLATILLCLSAVGFSYRLLRFRFDAIYILFYMALMAIWPYPYQAGRFLFVLLPILLFHMLVAGELAANLFKRAIIQRVARYAPAVLAVITVFPTIAIFAHRAVIPLEPALKPYRHTNFWYLAETDANAKYKARTFARIFSTARGARDAVPETECIYSTNPAYIWLYTRRWAMVPPSASLGHAQFLQAAIACRYFFMTETSSPQLKFPALYPLPRIRHVIRPLLLSRYMENGHLHYAAILAERVDLIKHQPADKH